MTFDRDHGMVHLRSVRTVPETLARLKELVQGRGISVVAEIDHSGAAAQVGLSMPPTKLLIFGNPKAGTPLMAASPTLALDLPLKALIWQDGEGQVWLSYNSPGYLQERHGIPGELMPNIAGIQSLAEEAAG